MSQTEQEIVALQEKIKDDEKKLKNLKEKYDLEKKQAQKLYYTIRCKPSKSDHCEHTKGLFSTFDKALACLPVSHSSHDSEDDCTWYYSVETKQSDNLNNYYDSLDKSPEYFPYTGW